MHSDINRNKGSNPVFIVNSYVAIGDGYTGRVENEQVINHTKLAHELINLGNYRDKCWR